jgi:hypothetical protein
MRKDTLNLQSFVVELEEDKIANDGRCYGMPGWLVEDMPGNVNPAHSSNLPFFFFLSKLWIVHTQNINYIYLITFKQLFWMISSSIHSN